MTNSRWTRVCLCAAVSFLFLLPLKFGSPVGSSGVPNVPVGLAEWLTATWPTFLAPVLAGVVLLAAVPLSTRLPKGVWRRNIHFLLPAAGLLVVSLIGLCRTTEWDMASQLIWHQLGAAALVLAVFLLVQARPDSRRPLAGALAAALVLALVVGWYQYQWGYDDLLREMAYRSDYIKGTIHHEFDIRIMLETKHVRGTMFNANAYAALLILLIPACVGLAWRAGRCFDPPKVSQWVLSGLVLVVSSSALVLTAARAPWVAVFGAGCALVLFQVLRSRCSLTGRFPARYAVLTALGFALVIGGFAVGSKSKHWDLGTARARWSYYRSAVKMFAMEPLTGAGLGEFFPYHLRLKDRDAEPTRMPHNLFLHFLSQCGVLGGAAALYFLLQPFILGAATLRGRMRMAGDHVVCGSLLFGVIAWHLHALVEVNLYVPGTMYIAAILPLLIFEPVAGDDKEIVPSRSRALPALLVVCAVACMVIGQRYSGEKAWQAIYTEIYYPIPSERLSLMDFQEQARRAVNGLKWSPYAAILRGRVYMERGEYSEAEVWLREGCRRAPHRSGFLAYLAQCLLKQGKLDEAETAIDAALVWGKSGNVYERIRARIRTAKGDSPDVD